MLPRSAKDLAQAVLVYGPITRGDLGGRLDLSAPSLTRLSKPLFDAGFLVETAEAAEAGTGRPARPLDIRPDVGRFLGVYITGDTAHGVATDLRATVHGQLRRHLRSREPAAVAELIAELAADLGVPAPLGGAEPALFGIGVSLDGRALDRRTVTARGLGWADVPLAELVEEASGLPAVVDNDVLALTAAHHWFGLARGLPDFAVVTLGATVGYGLVTRGRVVETPGTVLVSHIPLGEDTGPACPDGLPHHGCAAAVLSTTAMQARAEEALGRRVGYDELLTLATSGEPAAVAIVRHAAWALGRLIGLIGALTLSPVVVLAGEGIGLWDVASARVLEATQAQRGPAAVPPRIAVDATGATAWPRGAAALAIQEAVDRMA